MICLPLILALLFTSTLAQRGLTVHTQQGDVAGTLSTPTVRRWLGIPFAKVNRWKPPQVPPRRSGVFHATRFGPSCPQDFNPANTEYLILTKNQVSNLNVTQSEDCLSVNIWSPTVDRKQNTAVLVWIYGGGVVWGTSNISVYDGTNIVRDNEDITIVSFNYRLNIFGQPNAPQLASTSLTQNFGLLDAEAAITWIYNNIANFGGDPNRITLFGQSAGAVVADLYLFAHPHDTIIKGTILQSGNAHQSMGRDIPINSTLDPTPWNTVAGIVGCGNSSTPAQFACMQVVPFKELQDTVISTNILFDLVIDNITAFSDILDRTAARKLSPAPLLGGTTAQEADIFVVAQEIVAAGVALPVITELISDLQTQVVYTCPTGAYLASRTQAGLPTWRYQYQAIIPGISTRTDLRSYHSSEIPMVFGTYNLTTSRPSQTEIALSKYIQQLWVAFARDPKRGLLNFGWPLYDPNTTSLGQIGNVANETGVVFMQGSALDASCAHADVLNSVANEFSTLL